MAVIRFNPDDVLQTDSVEYEVLYNATQNIKGVPGGIVEIGTRRGGSARLIIDALISIGEAAGRTMFCIDPYGNIPYDVTNLNATAHHPGVPIEGDPESKELTTKVRCDYNNNMRDRVIPNVCKIAHDAKINFIFLPFTDTVFFQKFDDGWPEYNEVEIFCNTYALVFFDGPHTPEKIKEELDFFVPKTIVGSIFVFDDIWMYNHQTTVEDHLFQNGFELLEKKNVKASYRKIK